MKTTTFDATELGLLEKEGFKVLNDNFAEKDLDGKYLAIEKLKTNDFIFSESIRITSSLRDLMRIYL